jgi:hypothetical protein
MTASDLAKNFHISNPASLQFEFDGREVHQTEELEFLNTRVDTPLIVKEMKKFSFSLGHVTLDHYFPPNTDIEKVKTWLKRTLHCRDLDPERAEDCCFHSTNQSHWS